MTCQVINVHRDKPRLPIRVLTRVERLRERVNLQLRLEAYNVFTHANAFVICRFPENEISNGYVPAFYDGRRNVQLAAKVLF